MDAPLSSLANPQVKAALRLRKASERRATRKFLIDGWREIQLAVKSGLDLTQLFVPPAYISRVEEAELNHTAVQDRVAEKLSYGQRAAEPVAVASTPNQNLDQLKLGRTPLVLALDRTEKPGNIGACFRSAEACGATVILSDPICEVFNPNVIRSSRGAIFSLDWAVCTAPELRDYCRTRQMAIYCARVEAEEELWDLDLKRPSCVVFGNEAQGLDSETWGSEQAFSIPMEGQSVDSLNLSNSAAVTLYEGLRQRRGK